jgi:hypothetical protein
MRVVSSTYVNLQFFYFYESFLLQKFVDAKNMHLDSINSIRYLASANSLGSKNFFSNYRVFMDLSKESNLAVSSVMFNPVTGELLHGDKNILGNDHYYCLKQFLFFIAIANFLNLYKLFSALSICTIYK